MTDPLGNRIHVEQLEIFSRIGVPAAEREIPQRLITNITIWPERDLRDMKDDIRRTVDYAALSEETKKLAASQTSRLVETLADSIAAQLLKTFAIRKVSVELRKFALPDAAYASVTVTRERAQR